MRTFLVVIVLATLVAFTCATPTPKVVVNVQQSANVELYLKDIVSAVEYAFKIGVGADGKMILLENELRTLLPNYSWFVTQGANGIAHTSKTYVYMRVVDGLIGYTVHIVGAFNYYH